MSAEERLAVIILWTGIVLFSALMFLGAGLLKTSLIVAFVVLSCAIGFGRRRLFQVSLAVSLVAIAVLLGFPHPRDWSSVAKSALTELNISHVASR